MRRITLADETLDITLTGVTMLEALQSHVSIPYANIKAVYDGLNISTPLLRLGGTAIGDIHEGHFYGDGGWYFLSYEHPDLVVTVELTNFHLGRQHYVAVAIEAENPQEFACQLRKRLRSTLETGQ